MIVTGPVLVIVMFLSQVTALMKMAAPTAATVLAIEMVIMMSGFFVQGVALAMMVGYKTSVIVPTLVMFLLQVAALVKMIVPMTVMVVRRPPPVVVVRRRPSSSSVLCPSVPSCPVVLCPSVRPVARPVVVVRPSSARPSRRVPACPVVSRRVVSLRVPSSSSSVRPVVRSVVVVVRLLSDRPVVRFS
jgi:hypothetical protein